MHPNAKRRFQIIIGFSILAFAVIVSYFSVEEIDLQILPQYDIFLVIDVSGSMQSEQKIVFAKQAALEFADEFLLKQPVEHQIGLVSFSDTGRMLVALETNSRNLKEGISQLYPDGETAMGDGISIAAELLSQETRPDTKKVIILLSDGMSNTGTNPLIAAGIANDNNVSIFSVAYGSFADTQTLKAIASLTDGKYYNALTGQDLAKTFNEITDTLISPLSHYSSRLLILIALPVLLFIPTIERGLATVLGRTEIIKKQKETPNSGKKLPHNHENLKTSSHVKCSFCESAFKSGFRFCAKCGTLTKGKVI